MASEIWKSRTLGECATFGSGGTPSKSRADFWTGSIPWVSAKDLKVFRLYDAEDHVTSKAVDEGSRLAPAGSIFLLVRGMTLHKDVPICVAMREMAFNQDIKALMPKGDIDAAFLTYWLLSQKPALLSSVDSAGHGTGRLNTETLKAMTVRLPPLAEQKRIAEVLGALDDKTELTRRMNATLEATARALFQSWFADFDPVRAKLDGRAPSGMDSATAALFPGSFEESPLGHIPKGWEVGKLGKFMQVGIGGAWGEEIPNSKQTVGVRCLRGIDCNDLAERKLPEVPIRYLSSRQFEDRRLSEGCILVEGSGSFCGRSMVWLSEFEQLVGSSVCYSNFCKRLDPLCTPSQALVCWMQLRAANDTGELANFRTGTAFPNFDIHGALLGLKVVCPPKEICDRYLELYRSWLRLDLVHQSLTLATIRDTLLPKLLSGEITIKEAA